MTIKEAVNIVKKDNLIPVKAYEGNKYIIFLVTDNAGNGIGNNCSYVVDKNKKTGSWVPKSAFPLNDGGEIIEHDF